MKSFVITFFILFCFTISVTCQAKYEYSSEWQVKLNGGFNMPISRLLTDTAFTNNLICYRDRSTYWNVSVAYFFHKHWGTELAYQGLSAKGLRDQDETFRNEITAGYGNNFYVTPSTSTATSGHSFERGFIGLIYRVEKGRWFVYPKLSVGVSSFYLNWGYALLKEKNTNRLLALNYGPGKRPSDHFTMAASAAFGYKISKRIYVNMEIMTSRYKTDFSFSKEIKDLNTNTVTSETFVYKKTVSNLNAGAGLIIAF